MFTSTAYCYKIILYDNREQTVDFVFVGEVKVWHVYEQQKICLEFARVGQYDKTVFF